jgi:murein DD-endopeptidase MepM/ murein hydrolase activator NlpD
MQQPILASLFVVLGATLAHGCPVGDAEASVRLTAPMSSEVTSNFGPRLHPILQVVKMHPGVDYRAARGDRVNAAASGTVTSAGMAGAYGMRVTIRHNANVETTYSHLSRVDVAVGDCVVASAPIGRAGSTGLVSTSQLHFELKRDGRFIDPLLWMSAGTP